MPDSHHAPRVLDSAPDLKLPPYGRDAFTDQEWLSGFDAGFWSAPMAPESSPRSMAGWRYGVMWRRSDKDYPEALDA